MEPLTLDMLATTGGMAIAVAALVQATKYFYDKINPKFLALAWAFILNVIYFLLIAPEHSASLFVTALLNVPFVAVTASGAYEYGIKALQNRLAQAKEAKEQGNAETGDGEGE